MKGWHARYAEAGLVIVGVHSPEFAHERSEAYVRERLKTLGIRYPVVMDNSFRIWKAYNTWAWPTTYLIDPQGLLRFKHIGEGEYERTEALIRQLLAGR
ncbi:MAG: redoxin domain-containing protein [Armatimonadetes bacterium]|nr:redoxin domain-containing protein [Armatimonadota bacterium]